MSFIDGNINYGFISGKSSAFGKRITQSDESVTGNAPQPHVILRLVPDFSLRGCLISGADLGILRGGGGSGPEFFKGRGVMVQVRRHFHILTSKKTPLMGV